MATFLLEGLLRTETRTPMRLAYRKIPSLSRYLDYHIICRKLPILQTSNIVKLMHRTLFEVLIETSWSFMGFLKKILQANLMLPLRLNGVTYLITSEDDANLKQLLSTFCLLECMK